jgi:hypothetical protein
MDAMGLALLAATEGIAKPCYGRQSMPRFEVDRENIRMEGDTAIVPLRTFVQAPSTSLTIMIDKARED